jgi:hypothetical protein
MKAKNMSCDMPAFGEQAARIAGSTPMGCGRSPIHARPRR